LEYKTPAGLADKKSDAPRYRHPRWTIIAAGVAGTIAALVRWRTGKWYTYLGQSEDSRIKFELPLWFQLLESSIAGLLLTTALLVAVRLIHKVIREQRRQG
jgi:hypothetical protein